MSTTTTYTMAPAGFGPVEVTVADYGSGQPFLLLHGGAGPQSVAAFAELLASTRDARVLAPVHPGFGGTPRPETLHSIHGLAALYGALLDHLDLADVTVAGNSIGGWITAELALRKPPRISAIVLIDAVGIDVPGHPVADFFSLTMDEVFALSFHNPEKFRIDAATLPPAAQAIAAGNRAAIAAYTGASMTDPALAGPLATPGDSRPRAVGRQRRDRGRRLRTRICRGYPRGPIPAPDQHRPLPAAGDPRPGPARNLGQRQLRLLCRRLIAAGSGISRTRSAGHLAQEMAAIPWPAAGAGLS